MKKSKTKLSFGKHAMALGRRIRVSPQKLNLVAALIRGLPVEEARVRLGLCSRRIAHDVQKILMSAVANAEHNKGLDPDTLYVTEATVGRALVMRRLDIKGRSRSGRIEKPFSHLRVVVSEAKA